MPPSLEFDLDRTRIELQLALDALSDETHGQAHSERARAFAIAHAWTAILLLRGSLIEHLVGVPTEP